MSTGTPDAEPEPITASVRIAAPPDVVFPYFTDPVLVTKWLADTADLDARPGGDLYIVVSGNPARGKFVAVDPPLRVVFTWGIEGNEELPPGASTVEVDLEAAGGDTVVTLTHRGLTGDFRQSHQAGWTHFLGQLAGLVAAGTLMDGAEVPTGQLFRERVSTGDLPSDAEVQAVVTAGYERFRHLDEGSVPDYIPALASASPDAFGVCIAGVHGRAFAVGDAEQEFTIQSISKLFVFALVCDVLGPEEARRKLGVNSTGLPFDSVMGIELNADRTMNPMVNAGALAASSLVPGATGGEKFENVVAALSRFAGRPLVMDDAVYESEAATNFRNRGIAHLLYGYDRMYCDPDVATDVYTRQCALLVSARDLAVMGATLADGGVNPMTGERAIASSSCRRVLAVLATSGLYERSGDWLYDVGLPGKSGVSGGLVTVSPGKGGVGTYSPPLDEAGNSVRGQRITTYLSEGLGLNLFASAPPASV